LEVDDGFGALQAQREAGIVALKAGQVSGQRIGFGGFRSAPRRGQAADGSRVPLAAPFGQIGRVETFAAQDGTDPAGIGGAIGLRQDAQLVLGGERPAARAIG
jgi:hypothetical protein